MSTPAPTAIYVACYGGEERVTVRRVRAGWTWKAPHYKAMTASTAEAARNKAERMHGFVRWEA